MNKIELQNIYIMNLILLLLYIWNMRVLFSNIYRGDVAVIYKYMMTIINDSELYLYLR